MRGEKHIEREDKIDESQGNRINHAMIGKTENNIDTGERKDIKGIIEIENLFHMLSREDKKIRDKVTLGQVTDKKGELNQPDNKKKDTEKESRAQDIKVSIPLFRAI